LLYPYSVSLTVSPAPTDKKFTGQRLDDTGLYYYNARYYDAEIAKRFGVAINFKERNRFSFYRGSREGS